MSATFRKEKAAVTRAALLRAAKVWFDVHGYEGATVRDIARTAGVSTGAFFAHWSGKAAAYEEIHGHPPITPEQGRELVAVLKGEIARPDWLLEMAA